MPAVLLHGSHFGISYFSQCRVLFAGDLTIWASRTNQQKRDMVRRVSLQREWKLHFLGDCQKRDFSAATKTVVGLGGCVLFGCGFGTLEVPSASERPPNARPNTPPVHLVNYLDVVMLVGIVILQRVLEFNIGSRFMWWTLKTTF